MSKVKLIFVVQNNSNYLNLLPCQIVQLHLDFIVHII
jgi:hypothetical protein